MRQFGKYISIFLVWISPFEIEIEIFSSQTCERSLKLKLESIQQLKWSSIAKFSVKHSNSFSIKLLHQMTIERSFLFCLNINNRYKINMVNLLTSLLNNAHITHVIFHSIIKLLLIMRFTKFINILFSLLNFKFQNLLLSFILFLNIRTS